MRNRILLLSLAALAGPVFAEPASESFHRYFPPDVSVCAVPPGSAAGSVTPPAPSGHAPGRAEVRWDGERDLGVMRWPAVEARPLSAEIPFEVRAGTVGLVIRAETPAPGWDVSVELLAGGELLACDDCPDAPAVGETRESRGSVQMPSTDRPGWELEPGSYTFRVRATPTNDPAIGDGVTVDVLATFRTDAALEVEHRLDLNFVYLPGCALSAAVADTSTLFDALLASVDARLEPIGLSIGRVTHVDLDRPEFGTIWDWAEAGEMFRTSARVGRPRALNVYCIAGVDPAGPLNPAVGFSGGIPGPVQNGTRDSGVGVRTSPFFTCQNCLGGFSSLFAHEIGHYLGFYHTTEGSLDRWDPFSDTPQCFTSFPGGCPDYGNVMFPLIHTANETWSASQGLVALTHPLVRTVPVVTARDAERASAALAASGRARPNPFRTEVRLELPDARDGEVALFDVGGRLVRRLSAGDGGVSWDGADTTGRPVPAGIYFARWTDAEGRTRALRVVRAR